MHLEKHLLLAHKTLSNRILIAALMALLIGISLPQANALPVSKKVEVWRIEQQCQIYNKYVLYIGETGVKFVCPSQSLICVCSAPSWESTLINEKQKLYMTWSKVLWRVNGFDLVESKTPKETLVQKDECSWEGRPALRKLYTVSGADPLREQFEMVYRDSPGRSIGFSHDEKIFTRMFEFCPPAQEFFCGLFRLKTWDGFMVKRVRIYDNGRRDTVLDTLNYKKAMIDESEFHYQLTGLKKSKTTRELLQDKAKASQAAHMLEDMFDDKGLEQK